MTVYSQISERLKKQIKLGRLLPGEKLLKEVELAEQLGISRKTLRCALEQLEKEGLIIRRKHVGTVISEDAARSVKAVFEIGVALDFADQDLQYAFWSAVGAEDKSNEINLLIRRLLHDGVNLRLLASSMEAPLAELDGIVVINPLGSAPFLKRLADQRFPHVTLESRLEYPGVNTVMADDEQAAYECTRELIERGHRRIAFLGGGLREPELNTGFRRRNNGFSRACREFNVPQNPKWIFNVEGRQAYEMSELLEDYPRRSQECTAVVCAIGHSVLELEKMRKICGVSLIPELDLRCVDLHPFDLSPAAVKRLRRYRGFIKPREKTARTAYDKLWNWIGDETFTPECFRIPYEAYVPEEGSNS